MKRLIGLMAATFFSLSANAALVKINFDGEYYKLGDTPNAFHQSISGIKGYAIYESDTPGTVFGVTDTKNYRGALRGFGFEIYGDAGTVFSGEKTVADGARGFGYVQIRNLPGIDSFGLADIDLTPDEVVGGPDSLVRAGFTFRIAAKDAKAIDNSDLPGVFDPTIFNGQRNISLFLQRSPAVPGEIVSFNFNFWNLEDVTVEAVTQNVPEPGSLALLGMALAGVVATRRKPRLGAR
ncbi:PEP-CTERM sorting domain-containing protein [Thauera linaloolentis]|uniref:Ice-binding protein C-terminal domain-containing protein n=1 Tax=Thauera linaloolentis (strain DSM 12138 / JCM 21573 / CCUG 41526 / CIP 105981 / IAM 15112 / NBRC 102519 / 47Lol) TaxID=1123367 RepID=N6YU79_THAL4|nr:PEP-CTERM sorting domain-containing protein [Thauera linaloolentis]ENO83524.1 hypothetical protein C666_18765 [Thauera linaloolentis 47Lol = DSM 12138]MCM8564497.1 PEP-CTERM sorting domain-containing protein [Thauera linaloolentis]